ncbi:hypothetical protein [Thermococcus sp. 21S7]|nr:hypothetical protein [Thermococcus sp. 21S7]
MVRKLYPNPNKKVWPWISRIYDNGVMIIVANLYNVYENGDIIGHLLAA